MRDHKDAATLTTQEKYEQGRQDDEAARRHIATRFLADTTPEDREVALRVLDVLGAVSLDELSETIERDGHGNPLYLYGNRMAWSKAHDITQDAASVAHILRALNEQIGGDAR